jgi:16S rRNA C1402 N4-methylase RsmH
MHLTELAHNILKQYLKPGDFAIDATTGNGHDSCFLAQQVGVEGRVFAFDIQQQALDNAADRLRAQALTEQVTFIHRGHEHLLDALSPVYLGKIQAVMFNLGYLPGGDKQLTTTDITTLPALEQAAALLSPGGIITVLAYRGHPGGQEEAHAVEQILGALAGEDRRLSIIQSPGPVLFILAPNPHD